MSHTYNRKVRRNLVRAQARSLNIPMRHLWRMYQTGNFDALRPAYTPWYKRTGTLLGVLGGLMAATIITLILVYGG